MTRVARGFIVHAYGVEGELWQRHFNALPIRLGRNPLNDFQLAQGFVSDFHARLEEVDGRLSVRDLGSKNGVYLRQDANRPPQRIPPQVPIDLTPYGYSFLLGPALQIRLEITENQQPTPDRDFKATGSVLGNLKMMNAGGGQQGSIPPESPAHAAGGSWPSGPSAPPGAPPPYGAPSPYGSAPHGSAPPPVPGGSLPSLPPLDGGLGPANPMPAAYAAQPYAARAAHPSRPSIAQGVPSQPPEKSTGMFGMALEALALVGLRELGSSLVPGRPLETTGDVARLITKLHDTVDVLCRCFIPMRDGYAQFMSTMDLERDSTQRSMNRSAAYRAVERARDPAAVATALLDWREQTLDAPKAIEGIFADLMIHQVALLDGVMRGVRSLLDELAPDNIERLLETQGSRGPLGLPRALTRYKSLWETYRDRYEQLSQEKQAFSHIFGREFTEAYQEYGRRRAESTRP